MVAKEDRHALIVSAARTDGIRRSTDRGCRFAVVVWVGERLRRSAWRRAEDGLPFTEEATRRGAKPPRSRVLRRGYALRAK
jgi:hypothetical protein